MTVVIVSCLVYESLIFMLKIFCFVLF